MSNKPCKPQELTGKYITCFPCSSGWDCVRYSYGDREGLPYLYNSKEEAENDDYFDPQNDEVIKASEYFKRLTQ